MKWIVFAGVLAMLFTGTASGVSHVTAETSPADLWARARTYLTPYGYTVEKDDIIASDTDPSQQLRRIEVKFYTWELRGRKWGHPCVIFAPADRARYMAPGRRGRVVVVGQRSWDGIQTGPWRDSFLGNYGEPIATRTGYPTMICPVPGEYDGTGGRELSFSFFRQELIKTEDPARFHGHYGLAAAYLRGMDVMADVLEIPRSEIRAVLGGHSKRATCAYSAAAIEPDRVAGVVFMGNEAVFHPLPSDNFKHVIIPAWQQQWVKAKTLYIGGTNEDAYTMFSINQTQEYMHGRWTIAMIPNYRHASQSEMHPMDWMMWISHCFDGRPVTKISDATYEEKGPGFMWGGRDYGAGGGTLFRCRIDSPNKIIQVKVWYVYNDDPPYWRDLMWYPEFMVSKGDGVWEGYVKGKLPDAWLVEVKDTAMGFPGYVSSLPQDITHTEAKRRPSHGSRSRNWAPKEE